MGARPNRSIRPPPAESLRAESDALWDALRDCHRRVRSELRSVVVRHGIYPSEYRALNQLMDGPRTPTQLAEALGLAPASVTDLSAQLVARGWATRRPHPADRRAYLLRMTPKGRRTRDAARAEFRSRLVEVYGELPPASRARLRVELGRLAGLLEQRERDQAVRATG
jgi:DNA-binding MarR family transcriptional regulator